MARWIPLLSILIVYTGFSFGYAGIPYIFQVKFNYFNDARRRRGENKLFSMYSHDYQQYICISGICPFDQH